MDGRRIRGILTLVAAGMLITGCSSGSRTALAPPTSTTTRASAEQSLALRAVLQLSDLPTGYEVSTAVIPPVDRALQRELLACVHLPPSVLTPAPGRARAIGQRFIDRLGPASARAVTSAVAIEPPSVDLPARFAAMTGSRAAECLQTALSATLAHDPALAKAHVEGLTVRPLEAASVGDQRAAFVGHYSVGTAVGAASADLTFHLYLARRGRAVALLEITAEGASIPTAFASSLLETVLGRLAAAV